MITNLATGSDECVRTYIERVTGARLQAGFQIYEITEGLLLLKEVVLPVFQEYYQTGVLCENDAIMRFDQCLRLMISQF